MAVQSVQLAAKIKQTIARSGPIPDTKSRIHSKLMEAINKFHYFDLTQEANKRALEFDLKKRQVTKNNRKTKTEPGK